MYISNGQQVRIDQDLTIGDGDDAITYPSASLLCAATRAEIGIVDAPDSPRADDRAYWNGNLNTPRPLADIAGQLWDLIKAHRDRLQVAGCKVADDWFHNDVKSRTQWERMANRSASMADDDIYLIGGLPVQWKTMTGSFVALTAGKIRAVVEAFEVNEAVIFAQAERHKVALTDMTTAEAIITYDWRAGWPKSFADEVRP